MEEKIYVQKFFSQIKESGTHLNDWDIFIQSLRYPLLSILSRQYRNNITESSENITSTFNPHFFTFADKASSAIKCFLAVWQRCKIKYNCKAENFLLYTRPDDRFFNLYQPFLDNNLYGWVTDRIYNSSNCLQYTPIPDKQKDLINAYQYYHLLLHTLQDLDLHLMANEARRLNHQTLQAIKSISRAHRFFSNYPVDALVLDGDSWLPVNVFARIAAEEDIPVLCIQHGLDCEHWCLDEAFSPYYCVWGAERKKRYREHSMAQPKKIFLTGNPLYDNLRPPSCVSSGGNNWLLLTRPHTPEKCYEQSRYPEEGIDVLRMILSELISYPDVVLTIKPHPKDNIVPYQLLIISMELSTRVFFTPLLNSLESITQADIIFTEDSTTGSEAMILGKPIVHVSACEIGPCMPFTDYDAAYSGLSEEKLNESIARIMGGLNFREKNKMHKGQLEFLHDYCGHLDGKSSQRVATAIKGIL